ncbi:MOSC domain-containing protein [Alteromonas flava]|uniref:MOSC domain-containing protein n=1 Tax=Alteromonas flava TaxID=2048003 RepID=UPI000C295053|nr:MOSC domain-containing protein [Alteromonas flava]
MFINQLFAAKPVAFGPRGAPSSIIKSAVQQLTVAFDGTQEDEQGNKKLHGGKEKVLHQYAPANYKLFQQHFPEHTVKFVPGSIGENISIEGMDDDNTLIGDVVQMGKVVLQVGSPRVPCNKISHRFGIKNLDRFVNTHNICGWYYRVLETGIMSVGDPVSIKNRNAGSMSIREFMQCVNDPTASKATIERAAALDGLDPEWQLRLQKRAALL